MSVPTSLPIANTSGVIAGAELEERDRVDARDRRRRLMRRIDQVLDECERAHLRAKPHTFVAPPSAAVALCLELQAAAGDGVRTPETATEALDELFRLQERYMLGGDDQLEEEEGDDDQVADVDDPAPLADPLGAFCSWLELAGGRVRPAEVPVGFRPLLSEQSRGAVIYRDRGCWRVYRNWRERRELVRLAAAAWSALQ